MLTHFQSSRIRKQLENVIFFVLKALLAHIVTVSTYGLSCGQQERLPFPADKVSGVDRLEQCVTPAGVSGHRAQGQPLASPGWC